MRRCKKITLFLLYLHIWTIFGSTNEKLVNQTSSYPPPPRSHHPFAKYWPFLSIIGIFGIFLNIFVLYSFYSERATMVSSVNIMIGQLDNSSFTTFLHNFHRIDTMYRLVYSLIGTHWRNYNMYSDKNLFHTWIDLEMVK